ncbi:hypothetical protein R3P38DRAFT_2560277, partial [Favolaschia claudopus]
IPLEYVRTKSMFLSTVNFCHQVPQRFGKPMIRKNIPFHSLEHTDDVFGSVTTNFAVLPARSRLWYSPVSAWNVFADPQTLHLPDVHIIETPEVFVKTPSPVYETTTEEWTKTARAAAKDSNIAIDLEDLEDMIKDTSRERYIEMNTTILDGKVLQIQDPDGNLLSDIFTLPQELYQKLKDAVALIQGAMHGEWRDDTLLNQKCLLRHSIRFFLKLGFP